MTAMQWVMATVLAFYLAVLVGLLISMKTHPKEWDFLRDADRGDLMFMAVMIVAWPAVLLYPTKSKKSGKET